MPGGRPPKINTVVLTRPDPETGRQIKVTAGERIVEAMRIGEYVETAAALAGVSKASVYEWLKVGANAHTAVEQGATLKSLSQHQRDCMEFSDAVAQAQAAARVEDVATLAELGRGGRQVITTTTKRDGVDGKVVEHVTKTETTQPDARVLMWRLERRFPDEWGRRRIEVSGPDGEAIPVEVRAGALVAALRQHQGRADAIDTTATETTMDDEQAGEG